MAIRLTEVLTKLNRDVRRRKSTDSPPFAQLSVLRSLLCEGDATVSDLARREHTDQPSVSRAANQLTRRGFAERAFHPTDGRVTILHLTPRGREVALQDIEQKHDLLTEKIESLTEGQRRTLGDAVALLTALAKHGEILT